MPFLRGLLLLFRAAPRWVGLSRTHRARRSPGLRSLSVQMVSWGRSPGRRTTAKAFSLPSLNQKWMPPLGPETSILRDRFCREPSKESLLLTSPQG